jgi:hypothetical protein
MLFKKEPLNFKPVAGARVPEEFKKKETKEEQKKS